MIPEFIQRQTPALQARARVAAVSLLALTDAVQAERAELAAAGVSASRIQALYPLLPENIEAFHDLLDNEGVRQQTSDLLTERQFETGVQHLPRDLVWTTSLELADAGMDDQAKWTGAFAVALHKIDNDWLAYQYANLLAFLNAVASAPFLVDEPFVLSSHAPMDEHYEGPWISLTKWVEEAEDVAQRFTTIVGSPNPAPSHAR